MTTIQDPPRLLDPASPIDPLLRDLLHTASAGTPSPAQLEALALKVGTATAAQVGASAAIHSRWILAKASVVKVSVALLVAGTAAWLGWSSQRTNHAVQATVRSASKQTERSAQGVISADSARRAADSAASPQSRGAPGPVPSPQALAVSSRLSQGPGTAARSGVAWSKHSDSVSQRRRRVAALELGSRAATRVASAADEARPAATEDQAQQPVPIPAPTRDAPSELILLSRAQGLLARDAQSALDVIAEHALLYPRGAFTQEREALAIDALRRLGRHQALAARARDFLQRYPSSPHCERIAAWLR